MTADEIIDRVTKSKKMKYLITVLLVFISFPVFSGYYAESRIDAYDPISGLYYKAIEYEPEKRGFMSKGPSTQVINISIYNPETGKHAMLFNNDKQRVIAFILYEEGIKDGRVKYFGSDYSQLIKNNIAVDGRVPKDKILIGVRNDGQKLTELWVSDKNGGNLTMVTKVPFSSSWHIDVKNSKLRVVFSQNGKFNIENFVW